MSPTCCKQLKCRPLVKPTSPYCVSAKSSKSPPPGENRQRLWVSIQALPSTLQWHTAPSTHPRWVTALPRSQGQLLLVTHTQSLLSTRVSVVHAVLGHVRVSDIQLRRVSCFWWVSSLPSLSSCNIRGALRSSLEVYFAHLDNFGTV